MTHLLQLGCQRAAADSLMLAVHGVNRQIDHSHSRALPFDGGVAVWIGAVTQLAIFDKQESVDHQRRNGVEVGVNARRIPARKQSVSLPALDLQTGLAGLMVDREDA